MDSCLKAFVSRSRSLPRGAPLIVVTEGARMLAGRDLEASAATERATNLLREGKKLRRTESCMSAPKWIFGEGGTRAGVAIECPSSSAEKYTHPNDVTRRQDRLWFVQAL